MADIQQIYFTTLTAVGEAKDAKAKALGTALKFTAMAVGDGNGVLPVPDRTRTALVREVRRASINTLKQDPKNPGQLIAEQVIPEDEGGWWIRELGLYDADGDLFAIANCPETYKPVLAQGSGRTQVVRMVLVMTSAASVQLKVDPSVVLATRQYVDDQDAAHAGAADPHPQYLTEAETLARIVAQGLRASAFNTIVGATVLKAAEHAGSTVYLGGAGGYTVTLPDIGTMPPGTRIEFVSGVGVAASSIKTAAAGQLIYVTAATSFSSIPMSIGDTLTLESNGTNWIAVSGSNQLGYSNAFSKSLAANGYQKLPSGLIIQWGQITQNDTGGPTFYSFNLPIAFPNGCLQASITVGSQINGGAVYCSAEGITNNVVNGYTSGSAVSRIYRIIAIGY
jgi:hypothetical protein